MDLKKLLKQAKMNENNISMILGGVVIIAIGLILVNYFRNTSQNQTIPTGVTTENADNTSLPTTHKVVKGETLWSIAEKYYKSGYNWVDIQKENNLSNASAITEGQELSIPDVSAKLATVDGAATPSATVTAQPTSTPAATATVSATPTATPKVETADTTKGGQESATSYTVVKGDSLWSIAVKVYGDGYQWSKIANANNLKNPSVIHTGNSLSIPR